MKFRGSFGRSYNSAGMTLAPRINEYGITIIGLVGNARNGCCGATGGVFGTSGGLCEPDLCCGFGVLLFDWLWGCRKRELFKREN